MTTTFNKITITGYGRDEKFTHYSHNPRGYDLMDYARMVVAFKKAFKGPFTVKVITTEGKELNL